MLCKIGISYESKKAFLFEMLSFPKNTFAKDQITKLLSLIKSEISKEKFQDITNSFPKETFTEEDYFLLIRENSFLMDLLNCLNKVNYIPYIFFSLPTKNMKMQRDCVSILMNNEKDLKTFIYNSLEIETEFYCVDISFWKEWCIYCDWDFGLNATKDSDNKIRDNKYFWLNENHLHIVDETTGLHLKLLNLQASKFNINSTKKLLLVHDGMKKIKYFDFYGLLLTEISFTSFSVNGLMFDFIFDDQNDHISFANLLRFCLYQLDNYYNLSIKENSTSSE